jgi:hypothetical protein
MGSLDRRARRLEEEAEYRERRKRLEAERVFSEALKRVSTQELEVMTEYFDRHSDREEWAEEDLPLMKRLLGLVREVRAEEAVVRTGEFPWQAEMREEQGHGD